MIEPIHYLVLSVLLFVIGAVGVMVRRNAIILFMCVELMLNSANLALVTFSRMHNDAGGTMLVFFVMCVAAAEAVVGLAIIIAMFRNRQTVDVNSFQLFKW